MAGKSVKRTFFVVLAATVAAVLVVDRKQTPPPPAGPRPVHFAGTIRIESQGFDKVQMLDIRYGAADRVQEEARFSGTGGVRQKRELRLQGQADPPSSADGRFLFVPPRMIRLAVGGGLKPLPPIAENGLNAEQPQVWFSPDGDHLVCAWEESLSLVDLPQLSGRTVFRSRSRSYENMANGRSGSRHSGFRFNGWLDGKTFMFSHFDGPMPSAFASVPGELSVFERMTRTTVMDLEGRRVLSRPNEDSSLYCRVGSRLFRFSEQGRLSGWLDPSAVSRGEWLVHPAGDNEYARLLNLSPDGDRYFVSSRLTIPPGAPWTADPLRLVEVDGGRGPSYQVPGYEIRELYDFIFSPDGRQLALLLLMEQIPGPSVRTQLWRIDIPSRQIEFLRDLSDEKYGNYYFFDWRM